MKVKELMELLASANPDGDIEFASDTEVFLDVLSVYTESDSDGKDTDINSKDKTIFIDLS